MKILPFHIHSDNSIFDGVSKIEEYAKKISSNQDKFLQAMMMSEHGTLSSQLETWKMCKKYNLKYIPANEIYFQKDFDPKGKVYHLLLFSLNMEGYRNLIKANNMACQRGYFIRGKIIHSLDILSSHTSHTYLSTACIGGYTSVDLDESKVMELYNVFGNKLIMELQTFKEPKQGEVNQFNQRMAKKLDLNMILASDAHCVDEKDTPLINVARSMGWKMPLSAIEKRYGKVTHNTYLKTLDDFKRENDRYSLMINPRNIKRAVTFGEQLYYQIEDMNLYREQTF